MTESFRRVSSVVVFVGVALGALALWIRTQSAGPQIPGEAATERHTVASLEAARVRTVFVRPGDPVALGAPVVSLETSDLDTALAVARGQLEELLAQVEAKTLDYARGVEERRLELRSRLAAARAEVAVAKTAAAARDAELQVLTKELARLDEVVRSGLAEVDRLSQMRARQERLSGEARYAPRALAEYQQLAEQMGTALDRIGDEDLAIQLRPLRAAADTQSRRIDDLLARRSRRVLRAPVAGQVGTVSRSAGDAVRAGDPVLEIIGVRARRMIAYVPEEAARKLTPGSRVEATSKDRSINGTATGTVEQLGPEIVLLPRRFWPRPDFPLYGRPAHVRLDAGAMLLPGEATTVRAIRGGAVAATTPDSSTQLALVPSALLGVTRVEPSGALWLPERQRFLVVSDDTGYEGRGEHSPLVLLASADGHFDEAPLPIEGIGEISDLEGVTRAPDGSIWLMCSQSRSRKGKLPTKRQCLLRTKLESSGLRVTGQVALFQAIVDNHDPDTLGRLGIGMDLDIEGVAWHDGGLLLGLKGPQDGEGRAILWHLKDPDALVDGRGFARGAAELQVAGVLKLPTGPTEAPGGVSELLVDGGRLFLLSTLAEGPDAGAAWVVDLPLGGPLPKRLATWTGVKPEGLGRGGDGRLTVFFDTGDETPRVTRLSTETP